MDYNAGLQSINAAIAAIEQGAQEYRIGTRTVRRADLATLYAERVRLERQAESRESAGIIYPRLVRRR